MSRRRAAAKNEQGAYYRQRQDDLRRAAATLFKERGYANVTLDDIAKSAGLNRATIYYYTSSKDEIFLDLAFDSMNLFVSEAEDIIGDTSSPIDKIKAFVVSLMDNYERSYPYLYVFMQEHLHTIRLSNSDRQAQLLKLSHTVDDLLLRIVEAGIADGTLRNDLSPRIVTYGILGMNNWSQRWFRPGGKMTGKQIGQQFAEMIIAGLRAEAV